ncbi:protein MAK16 homolog isoform X2 [Zingiber officinale]|uniref:protein MAK16 homolog isoform X2 n=1 Tax=Zingiber officinale TaxID=94328 RepID=UPI001C4C0E8A|nr:protein MAK16 homolog isoform X2 [Zingiber officinale]
MGNRGHKVGKPYHDDFSKADSNLSLLTQFPLGSCILDLLADHSFSLYLPEEEVALSSLIIDEVTRALFPRLSFLFKVWFPPLYIFGFRTPRASPSRHRCIHYNLEATELQELLTVEELWERVKLPRNYEKAIEIIDKHMEFWPKLLVHKIKQRLTKMTQCRIRMRKIELKVREKIMTVPRKKKKREARREEKAEKAAVLDKSIETELLECLKKGVYGDIYNYPVEAYNNILEMEGLQPSATEEEEEAEIEYVEGYDGLEEEEDMEDFDGLMNDESFLGNDEDGMQEDNEEMDRLEQHIPKKLRALLESKSQKIDGDYAGKKPNRKGRVIIEVEEEGDPKQKALLLD